MTSFFNVESLRIRLSTKLVAMLFGEKNGKNLVPELRFGNCKALEAVVLMKPRF